MRTRGALARGRSLWLGAGAIVVVAAAASLVALNRPEPPPAPVTLRIGYGAGGYRSVESIVAPPVLVRDGVVYQQSPLDLTRPGPVLRVVSAPVDPSTADRWARELRDAGVGTTTDWGQGPSPALEVLLEDGRGRATASLPGFSPEVVGGEVTGPQRHRNGVARVLSEISDHLQRNGIAATPPLVRYASRTAPLTDYGLPILDWPASTLADGDFTPDGAHGAYRCRLLSAEESSAVRAAARDATGRVLWRTGSDTWLVVLSPLLPGETACTPG